MPETPPHYGQFAPEDRLTGIADPVVEVVRQTKEYLEREVFTDG